MSFLITLSLLISKEVPKTRKKALPDYENSTGIDPSQFLLPRYVSGFETKKYYFLREREKKWNDKEVARYWHPVREAIGNSLKDKINREINKIFSGIKD